MSSKCKHCMLFSTTPKGKKSKKQGGDWGTPTSTQYQEYSFETVMMSVYPLSVSIKGKFGHLELRAPMKKRDACTRKKEQGRQNTDNGCIQC